MNVTEAKNEIAEVLQADSYFEDIPVFTERVANIESRVEAALGTVTRKGGKCGLCCMVLQSEGDNESLEVPGGNLRVAVTIRTMERVIVNTGKSGTGKAAEEVAIRMIAVLHQYASVNGFCGISTRNPAYAPASGIDGMYDLAYENQFELLIDQGEFERVATPVIMPTGGALPRTVIITCATPGASIYYTLDGTHPRVGNAGAQLYANPFLVETPKQVRARAYKSGLVGSNLTEVNYG